MTNSLYTDDIKNFIRTRPWPKGLVLEVREFDEPAPHLKLILFRDNWLTLSRDDHYRVVSIVKEVMGTVNKKGVPIFLDKLEHANER